MNASGHTSLDELALDVERVESLRAVKNVQRSYAQYSQLGRWEAMAGLFAADATLRWGDEVVTGRPAIASWLETHDGAMDGRSPGTLHTEIIDEPLVNLSVEGTSAVARWMVMRFLGDGNGAARIEGGLCENDYVLDDDRWRIRTLRYHPQFEGDDRDGWRNAGGQELPVIPTHFTADEAGEPIPMPVGEPPVSSASPQQLAERIGRLNDEDAVRNIQSAYGYYVDRRMWSDVVDLFVDDAVVSIAGAGEYSGRSGVRRALERMGPEGLTHGQLNERPLFDVLVDVDSGGRTAQVRGIELGLLGDANRNEGGWEFSVFHSVLVKDDGLWKLKELTLVPLLRADYSDGWAHGGLQTRSASEGSDGIPPFIDPTPVPVGVDGSSADESVDLDDLARRLARSRAYDGVENVSSAYGYYLDDFRWSDMAAIFAVEGHKQSPFAGYYMGRDRIIGAADANWGPAPAWRRVISFHWRTQPVIHVSHDGRSAHLRTRLFQPRTAQEPGSSPSGFYMGGLHSGMYPNDQAVLEDGIWRLWSLTIDEHYFVSPEWKGGWAAATDDPASSAAPPRSKLLDIYPPDVLLTELGRRQEGFRGGTGTTVAWPGILPMWFHYRNPVSGREPELFWPDCVPYEKIPEARMIAHGYQQPPNGPEIDGVEVVRSGVDAAALG